MILPLMRRARYIGVLLFVSFVSCGVFLYESVTTASFAYSYLVVNLVLAWIPLLITLRLAAVLRFKRWSSWEGLAWSLLWLIFLPNAFYMVSDFIHLKNARGNNIVFLAVMFTMFINTALVLGYSSLYPIHREIQRRFSQRVATTWVVLTIVIASLAIYIGRDLRWNSWNVFTNPGGLLFDVSDRLFHPTAYPDMLRTIAGFFILISTFYVLVYYVIAAIRTPLSDRH